MAKSSKLVVVISSRCDDNFPRDGGPPLSSTRIQLKDEIEALDVFGKKIFEVWINEKEPPQGGTWDSWDTCTRAVKDCDILIVLCNGNAGWAKEAGDIGICHAELMTGLSQARAKVRLIALGNVRLPDDQGQAQRNKNFQDYVQLQSQFRGGKVASVDDLKARVKEAVRDALIALAQTGVEEANQGRFDSGPALDWSRLDFRARQEKMRGVLRDEMGKRLGSSEDKSSGQLFAKIAGCEVLIVPSAIPAALTVGPAKEMVGQPFLRDHELAGALQGDRGGPMHVIACHRTATESQAARLLGFPDAEFVSTPFGVFVADNVQKVQLAFLVNCRDEANTRHGAQRFFDWLAQTGEDALVAKRAAARARIVRAIAQEVGG
jgi:hypothetical protein